VRVWAYVRVAGVLFAEKLGKKQVMDLLELAQLDAGIAFRSDTGCKLAFRDLMTCNRRMGGGRVRMARGYEVGDI
jgi:hypothetical protein